MNAKKTTSTRWRTRWCVCALSCAWALVARRAHAEELGSAHLQWQRPLGSLCPPGAILEADVEAALGARVFTAEPAAKVLIRGSIEDADSGVSVRIEARNRAGTLLGTRLLHAGVGQCAGLRDALGLVLTVLLENYLPNAAQSDVSTDDSAHWGLGATVALASSLFPRAAVGGGPALSWELDARWQLRVDALYWLPVAIATPQGLHAELSALAGVVRGCPRLWTAGRRFELQACAGLQLGALFTTQPAGQGPELQTRLLASALVELRGRLHCGPLDLEAGAGPLLALERTTLTALTPHGAREPLFTPARVGVIFSLTFIIRDDLGHGRSVSSNQ